MKDEHCWGTRVVGRLLGLGALALMVLGGLAMPMPMAMASAAASTKVVRYHDYNIVVPRAWPVYDLALDPSTCVRFNRHALYLGRPSSEQRCQAHAVGRTEAILVEPLAATTAHARGNAIGFPSAVGEGAQPRRGSVAQLAVAARGLIVTATWSRNPRVVQRALGVPTIGALTARAASAPVPAAERARSASASAVAPVPAVPALPGAVFTGLGFDACSAPSLAQMSAWSSSPFHAAGIYLGGTNMACLQPNLTAAWVSEESTAGWHLIPTYVGLQAPTNSCGCGGINPGQAPAEGSAAASDAIVQAQAIGIGAGNPIYFDMEAYPRGGTNTAAVLAFLSAWTVQLHADGYESGVYSSGASGIADLAARFGSGFHEPDDIWIADWNGEQTTNDPFVPSGDWAAEQRLHQFDGSHNATYGGATLNIDSNYLNGATAAGAGGAAIAPVPELTVSPSADGTVHLNATWAGAAGVMAWRVLAGDSPSALTPLGPAATPGAQIAIAVHSAFAYFAVQALGSANQVLGTSQAVSTPAHIAIYGHSLFSPSVGLGGLPVGCFTGRPCHIATTISAGRTVIASTGREWIPADGDGILYFMLTPAGRRLLSRTPGHRLSVKITARDASGTTATVALNLIRFVTSGRGPQRSGGESVSLRTVGATAFVSSGWVGGILAGCFADAPCEVTTTIAVGRTMIARTGPGLLGANELGYLTFKLTPKGHAMLAHALGNQLGAHVTLTGGAATTAASIALVRFN
jgi:hypothetical protein